MEGMLLYNKEYTYDHLRVNNSGLVRWEMLLRTRERKCKLAYILRFIATVTQ